MINKYQKKAFSLIEVLIASSIFAVVLVLTTGVLAQMSVLRLRTAEMRKTNSAISQLNRQISDDIRAAGDQIKIDAGGTLKTFENGIVLMNWDSSSFQYLFDSSPYAGWDDVEMSSGGNVARLLVLADDDKYKVYNANFLEKKIFYKEFARLNTDGSVKLLTGAEIASIDTSNVISDESLEVYATFVGFAPEIGSTRKEQAYVSFRTTARTKGYDTVSRSLRNKTSVRTSVTSRSYK